jgi:hypothetical protein
MCDSLSDITYVVRRRCNCRRTLMNHRSPIQALALPRAVHQSFGVQPRFRLALLWALWPVSCWHSWHVRRNSWRPGRIPRQAALCRPNSMVLHHRRVRASVAHAAVNTIPELFRCRQTDCGNSIHSNVDFPRHWLPCSLGTHRMVGQQFRI